MNQISVVCPVFNTPPDWLREAVRSVLAEPANTVAGLVSVDDCSTHPDNPAALETAARSDPRVIVLRSERNGGSGAARNRGIAAARFPWVSFLDSDDLWLAGRGEALARALAADPEAAWVGGAAQDLLPDGTVEACPSLVPQLAPIAVTVGLGVWQACGPEPTRWLIGTFRFTVGQAVVRRAALRQQPFTERRPIGEDGPFFPQLSTRTGLSSIDLPFVQRRKGIVSLPGSGFFLRAGDLAMLCNARRLPELAPFQRELRWALSSASKRLAAMCLARDHRLWGLVAAARAWALDPGEVGGFFRFLRRVARRGGRSANGPCAATRRLSSQLSQGHVDAQRRQDNKPVPSPPPPSSNAVQCQPLGSAQAAAMSLARRNGDRTPMAMKTQPLSCCLRAAAKAGAATATARSGRDRIGGAPKTKSRRLASQAGAIRRGRPCKPSFSRVSP